MDFKSKIIIKASILLVIGAFLSCNDIKTHSKKEYNSYGIKFKNVKELHLNTFSNYGTLYDSIVENMCNDISPVLVFENDTAIFRISSFELECPKKRINWCPSGHQLLELNDKQIFYPHVDKNYSIDSLGYVFRKFYAKDEKYKEHHKNRNYRYTFIGFYRSTPIVTTQKILEKIFFEFNQLKIETDTLQLLLSFKQDEKFIFKIRVVEE